MVIKFTVNSNGNAGVKCPNCQKVYRNDSTMKSHFYQDCGKPQKCHLCPYTCKRKHSLKQHLSMKHNCKLPMTERRWHPYNVSFDQIFHVGQANDGDLSCRCQTCMNKGTAGTSSRRSSNEERDVKPNLMILTEETFKCKHRNCNFATDRREVLIMHILNHDDES
ncbi:hypothetical protein GWI33_014869 [Rhynchophorus ferrugineus]|uniref:C2H2-type domain-containing protein n=1 Tax=Rhynchophorus ferrugineus TaxID=354439 RepID=A0A834I6G9_RHYFE|nr:hypothetical protein GWI33_014869 [Rhynchophorus ferrugineus]